MIDILLKTKKFTDEILYWLTIRIGTETFYKQETALDGLWFVWMRGLHYFIWGWRGRFWHWLFRNHYPDIY